MCVHRVIYPNSLRLALYLWLSSIFRTPLLQCSIGQKKLPELLSSANGAGHSTSTRASDTHRWIRQWPMSNHQPGVSGRCITLNQVFTQNLVSWLWGTCILSPEAMQILPTCLYEHMYVPTTWVNHVHTHTDRQTDGGKPLAVQHVSFPASSSHRPSKSKVNLPATSCVILGHTGSHSRTMENQAGITDD